MLKCIAIIYTVMLNGYNQWLNIRGGGVYFIESSLVLVSVMHAFSHKKDATKQINNK